MKTQLVKNCLGVLIWIFCALKLPAQPIYSGVLAGWDFHNLPGGVNNFGVSPYAATTLQTNLSTVGLVRGSGVGTNGTAASRGWGGINFNSPNAAAAIAAGEYVTFTLTANPLFAFSLTNINELEYRRSTTGPTNGVLQFQVGTGAFTNIANLNYSNSTSGGGSLGPINLAAIPALQNILPGVPVTFRIVSWGGSSASGVWYLYDVANTTAPDLSVQGTVSISYDTFFPAYDSGPGFFSGENLVLTNTSDASIYVWSSSTPALSVTNWYLEGQMAELPIGASGYSVYGINLNPVTSPVYYIFALTNIGLFSATEPLVLLTTPDYANYTVTLTNAGIQANGVFDIPAAPVLVTSPASTNVFAGESVGLSTVASASGTLYYQWYQNGTGLQDGNGISGSASNLLTFNPAAGNQTGSYFAVITNQLGSVTSSIAFLNVVPIPSLNISNLAGVLTLNAGAGTGAVGASYTIQSATNLSAPVSWSPVQTNQVGGDGLISYSVTNTAVPQVFYRVQFP